MKHYKNLIGLLLVILLSAALYNLGVRAEVCFAIVAGWQLLQFGRSRKPGYCFNAVLTPEQVKEFEGILASLKSYDTMFKELHGIAQQEGGWAAIKALPKLLKEEGIRTDETRADVKRLLKLGLGQAKVGIYKRGSDWCISDQAARALASDVILGCNEVSPRALERLLGRRSDAERQALLNEARMFVEQRAPLDATSTPLPTIYVPQVIELVWQYGQARQFGTVYPLGAGTVKLPRLQAGEDNFAFLGVGTAGFSQTVTERKVTAELVTFTANKAGGLIRIPTEIEEDTFIPLGQFLARYIARQLAKLEDKTMFLGDGTSTYANITGVGPYCASGSATYLRQLLSTKTHPSDATITDFRGMRALVNPAVLVDDPAYYMNPTMEALLVTFNTLNQPLIYRPAMGGQPATLDGFPIRWTAVLQPYTTSAAASMYIAVFGSLRYFYLGERGAPRIEVSREVFFATDEIAMRALERIDVEAMAIDAMSALQLAAS